MGMCSPVVVKAKKLGLLGYLREQWGKAEVPGARCISLHPFNFSSAHLARKSRELL